MATNPIMTADESTPRQRGGASLKRSRSENQPLPMSERQEQDRLRAVHKEVDGREQRRHDVGSEHGDGFEQLEHDGLHGLGVLQGSPFGERRDWGEFFSAPAAGLGLVFFTFGAAYDALWLMALGALLLGWVAWR